MNALRFLISFSLFILICSFGKKKDAEKFDPNRIYTVAELQQDFNALRKEMEKKQPNLYLYTPKSRMDAIFDSLFAGINKPMNFYEFYYYITPINSFIKDGHNLILPGQEKGIYADKHQLHFPLHITCLDGRFYSDMNYTTDTSLYDGAEILRINSESVSQIRKDFLIRMVRDGDNETFPDWILNTYFRGFFCYFKRFPEKYFIEYKAKDGLARTAELKAMPYDSIQKYWRQKYAVRVESQKARLGMRLRFDSLSESAIMTVSSFDQDINRKQLHIHFKKEIRKFFRQIDSAGVGKLIIDVRDNQGGDPTNSLFLLQFIMNEKFQYAVDCFRTRRFNPGDHFDRLVECRVPGFGKGTFYPMKNSFKGKVIVLMNGGSFSATGEFVSVLNRYKRAVLVGEESGGNKTICGGQIFGNKLKLPNTHIICNIGTEATLIRNLNENDGHGTMPDFVVKRNITDIVSNHDTVLEFALKLVRKN